MKKYEFFEHTADVKFKSYGGSLNEVFENCALAVSKIISRDEK
ncbi:archease, partial [Candidatus Parvarchaeota archaeon]